MVPRHLRSGRYVLAGILALAVLLCQPLRASFGDELARTGWQLLFRGIEHATGSASEPRLQVVNAVRVDLTEPGISFITTPSNGDLPGDTTRQRASRFTNEFGVQVAVNTHFYHTSAEIDWKAELFGLSISKGEVVSAPVDLPHGGKSLLITEDNRARFEKTAPDSDLSDVWTALEAWPVLVVKGENRGDPTTESVHPRTAVGLSQDGRYMVIIAIDGRQPGYSEGATFHETAQWLIAFGAHEGINLDGGGSTHLWVDCPESGPRALNRPSENRAVASHLGIYAQPMDHAPED